MRRLWGRGGAGCGGGGRSVGTAERPGLGPGARAAPRAGRAPRPGSGAAAAGAPAGGGGERARGGGRPLRTGSPPARRARDTGISQALALGVGLGVVRRAADEVHRLPGAEPGGRRPHAAAQCRANGDKRQSDQSARAHHSARALSVSKRPKPRGRRRVAAVSVKERQPRNSGRQFYSTRTSSRSLDAHSSDTNRHDFEQLAAEYSVFCQKKKRFAGGSRPQPPEPSGERARTRAGRWGCGGRQEVATPPPKEPAL